MPLQISFLYISPLVESHSDAGTLGHSLVANCFCQYNFDCASHSINAAWQGLQGYAKILLTVE